MSATDRQNRLLVAEDWKKIYQTFRNADFQSYDFENLRRTMIDYLRQNFPEDYNDYIESSEYLALIDLIAFLGQSIAFRVDLNARENFLELAERRDSVLRLARMISYNAKRNIAASGLLKITSIQSSQTIIDSNGRNLEGQVVIWNDSSNSDWYDQFIKVMNAAFPTTQQFGTPADAATIYGIPTEQYRFQSANTNIPVYSFTKAVDGRNMNFEITSTTFNGESYIYEEAPLLANRPSCVYRTDGQGPASPSTGFFFHFVQGNLNQGTFTISQPSANESVDIDVANINNNDVWLYSLDSNGLESELWEKISTLQGNNVIYNSVNKSIKNIYSVVTRASDKISLAFSDGTFGNLPYGTFRSYYRISNGLSYVVNPTDVRNVTISIPYYSNVGAIETLTITLGLYTSVSNASETESNASIKSNAPALYYTQNRMITGEDYNVAPLGVSQTVAKVKAVNRVSSGISRYFDLTDPTGKYSSTNLFADDGVVYQEYYNNAVRFKYNTKTEIEAVIYNLVYDIFKNSDLKNFYYAKYKNLFSTSFVPKWYNITSNVSECTGYIGHITTGVPYQVGSYTTNDLNFLTPGSLIKFVAPTGYMFDRDNYNELIPITTTKYNRVVYLWVEAVSVVDDGTAATTGTLTSGYGPITLSENVPTGAVVFKVLPKWQTIIDSATVSSIVDLIFDNRRFGLRYDITKPGWTIVAESNVNQTGNFSFAYQGDNTNLQKDASWMLLFTTDIEFYTITVRSLRHIFESDKQLRFYFDSSRKIYDKITNKIVNDTINVLSVNRLPDSTSSFSADQSWNIVSEYIGADGYIDTKKVILGFFDENNEEHIDIQTFDNIVSPAINPTTKFIVQERYSATSSLEEYKYFDNSSGTVLIFDTEFVSSELANYSAGQYFYFIDTNTVKYYDGYTLTASLDYKLYPGRSALKFQYLHSADYGSRIDPSASNIIDVYVLTAGYDSEYRDWISGVISSKPLPPSSNELFNYLAPTLNLTKSISDEIVYHPASYKVLFGSLASFDVQASFKVIKNSGSTASDNDIKSKVITAINQFFDIDNWDFGDTFYFSELAAYVMYQLSPAISNFVIVPRNSSLSFGNLFQITAASDQLFISSATVDDVEIIPTITPSAINAISITSTASTVITQEVVTSSPYGSTNG